MPVTIRETVTGDPGKIGSPVLVDTVTDTTGEALTAELVAEALTSSPHAYIKGVDPAGRDEVKVDALLRKLTEGWPANWGWSDFTLVST